jgi:hypothetical protein
VSEHGGGSCPAPKPVKVQGVTINPGDRVLVSIAGEWVPRIYEGLDGNGEAWMTIERFTTAIDHLPGPFALDMLRLPSFLDGFIKEIDAGE